MWHVPEFSYDWEDTAILHCINTNKTNVIGICWFVMSLMFCSLFRFIIWIRIFLLGLLMYLKTNSDTIRNCTPSHLAQAPSKIITSITSVVRQNTVNDNFNTWEAIQRDIGLWFWLFTLCWIREQVFWRLHTKSELPCLHKLCSTVDLIHAGYFNKQSFS